MKILIGCEYSGIVRDAFTVLGYDATSCDILPCATPGKHYTGNILDILCENWDVLIGFPPCTYLSAAGLHHCNIEKHGEKAVQRIEKRNEAVVFFLELYNSKIRHIAIENPAGHISKNILKPSQIIHPYYFGQCEMKRTCLWLKNLPLLVHAEADTLFEMKTHTTKPLPTSIDMKTGQKRYFTDTLTKNKLKSAHERNKTFPSIAQAMAQQWHQYFQNK